MEPTRDAARHLAAKGILEITQKGKVREGAAGGGLHSHASDLISKDQTNHISQLC
jgi:hypothetical protein